MLHIGCSGWSYDEWKGVLYPAGKIDKLTYYSAHFNTVEINSTFYSTPSEAMVNGWIEKVRERKNFLFSVKLPRELSHDFILRDPVKSASYLDAFQSMVLYPIRDAKRLGSVLLQLPPFFHIRQLEILEDTFRNVDHDGFSYFVEFRNSEFYGNMKVKEILHAEGLGVVETDSPDWHLAWDYLSGKSAYLRFHGYNVQGWANPSAGKMERYDYLYTSEEIGRFASVISEKMDTFSDIFIYFNNHPSGKAVRNAIQLAGALDSGQDTDQKLLY